MAQIVDFQEVKREKHFMVNEIFGPVLQGEGAMMGAQTYFIRFGGCDFRCSWCDTPNAVLPELIEHSSSPMSFKEMRAEIGELPGLPQWVTLSGGNPLLFELEDLVRGLQEDGYKVAVETQGSIYKDWSKFLDFVTLSPKPPSSGMSDHYEHGGNPAMDKFVTSSFDLAIKIVIADDADLEWATEVFDRYREFERLPKFFVQPARKPAIPHLGCEGDTVEEQLVKLNWLAEQVMSLHAMEDVRVLPQLHALMNMR